MRAVLKIRAEPTYRRGAFERGLEKLGYKVVDAGSPTDKRDLLVIWNRQLGEEVLADSWERQGGTVLVAENGYAGKDAEGLQLYAISVHGHNGSGWFPVSDEDRFAALNIELAPWVQRPTGYYLICGQRGIGSQSMRSPHAWETRTEARVKAMNLKTRVRKHPGRYEPATTLDQDLAGAQHCVIWSSSSGLRALAQGIPVTYCAPHWICESSGGAGLKAIDAPIRDDARRLAAMQRMAHAQWRVAEIESGEPFARILDRLGEAAW